MGYSSSCGQRGQSRLDWCFACGSACRSNLASTFSWKQIRVAWWKLHEMGSEFWCWNARKWRLQKIQIQRRGKCIICKFDKNYWSHDKPSPGPHLEIIMNYLIPTGSSWWSRKWNQRKWECLQCFYTRWNVAALDGQRAQQKGKQGAAFLSIFSF